jgi:hypothetical protein
MEASDEVDDGRMTFQRGWSRGCVGEATDEAQQNMQSETNFLRMSKMAEILKMMLFMMWNGAKIAEEAL